jgi:hypothetical protein
MHIANIKAIVLFIFVVANIFISNVSYGQTGEPMCTAVPNCGYFTQLEGALPMNTAIPVYVNNTPPAEAMTGFTRGIANINANATLNGSGTTFYVSTARPTTGSYVVVDFNSVPTNCGTSSTAAGCSSSAYDSTGTIRTSSHVDVNLGVMACGGLACYDRTDPQAYTDAVQGTIEHEFSHLLGNGDTETRGAVMGPFYGINNKPGAKTTSPCDNQAMILSRLYRQRGAGACR